MSSTMNRASLALAALLIAAAPIGAAFAGKGNGEPFAFRANPPTATTFSLQA